MKAYVIVIKDHPISEGGYSKLQESSLEVQNDFNIEKFDAIVPDTVNETLEKYRLQWNYPWNEIMFDQSTGLVKRPYGEINPLRRIACSLSHYSLWKKCIEINEPILILEHDSYFIQKLNYDDIIASKFQVVGINNPYESTFGANVFDFIVQSNQNELQHPPMLTGKEIPQGIAGNSAYIIKPDAAVHLLNLCTKFGLWPNDAIMCQQLCPFLGVTRTYYTKSQQLRSTTSTER